MIDYLLPFLVILTESRNVLVITSLRGGLVHKRGQLIIIVDTGTWCRLILLISFEKLFLPISD